MADLSVDVITGGGGDYTSLSTAESTEEKDLTTAGDNITFNGSLGGGSWESSKVTFGGSWNTSAGNDITVTGEGAEAAGINASKFGIGTTDDAALVIQIDYFTLQDCQLTLTYSSSDTYEDCVFINNISASNAINIYRCYFDCDHGATEKYIGITSSESDANIKLYSSIIHNFPRRGIEMDETSLDVRNVTCAYSTRVDGLRDSDGNGTAKNCAVFENNDDFDSFSSVDGSASDDGDGTNSVSPSGGDWSNEFSDHANGDYTLLSGGNLAGGGQSGGATLDIEGRTFANNDIGACAYVAAGGATMAAQYYRRMMAVGGR